MAGDSKLAHRTLLKTNRSAPLSDALDVMTVALAVLETLRAEVFQLRRDGGISLTANGVFGCSADPSKVKA